MWQTNIVSIRQIFPLDLETSHSQCWKGTAPQTAILIGVANLIDLTALILMYWQETEGKGPLM